MQVDPRKVRSRAAILRAAATILEDQGWSGLTLTAVSLRSGVARTTIYRQWPSRADLISTLIDELGDRMRACHGTDFRGDLIALLRRRRAASDNGWPGMRWVAGLADAALLDAELRPLADRALATMTSRAEEMIRRASKRGDAAAECDAAAIAAVVTSALVGPAEMFESLGRGGLERLADAILTMTRV